MLTESRGPYFVLLGGDATETQGPDKDKRYFQHASLSHIAAAYADLRAAGVPRKRIITIVQLEDFLSSTHVVNTPEYKAKLEKKFELMIKEGGATYDNEKVNPGTVFHVLLGIATQEHPIVVPRDASALFFLSYSHGDSHPSIPTIEQKQLSSGYAPPAPLPYFTNEWFMHLPYPSPPDCELSNSMRECVATSGARSAGYGRNQPECYLYATQLKCIFARLFSASHPNPTRPVCALLNYCRSGGALEFMKLSGSKLALKTDEWPLFMMSSCQPHHDALPGGLWTSFVSILVKQIELFNARRKRKHFATLSELFESARTNYHRNCVFELRDHTTRLAYASSFGTKYDIYALDIWEHLASGPGGSPDYEALRKMQDDYRSGRRVMGRKIYIWDPSDWGTEVDLVEQVKKARQRIAIPDAVSGEKSGVAETRMDSLLHGL